MKICVAQTRPVRGDIQSNIANHLKLVTLAVSYNVDVIIFPELSLTGYEPELAKELATDPHDSRLDDFQKRSDDSLISIGVGVPTKNNNDICISMILFQPNVARQTYSKKYLHPDEERFFVKGQNFPSVTINKANIALAICYELSVPEHAESADQRGAQIYLASVSKFMNGMEAALNRLSEIAKKYSMTVFMSNGVGISDGNVCAGKSSIWNNKGLLVAQLDDSREGILMMDVNSQQVTEATL